MSTFFEPEVGNWDSPIPMTDSRVKPLPSRINEVLNIDDQYVIKIAGSVFWRRLTRFDPVDLLKQEFECLELLQDAGFTPNPLYFSEKVLVTKWVGNSLSKDSVPTDWEQQVGHIATKLAERRIVHLDIKAANVLSAGGRLNLIDFGWSLKDGRGLSLPGVLDRTWKARDPEWIEGFTNLKLRNVISSVLRSNGQSA